MQQIRNFEEAHKVLETYMPPMHSQRGAYTLERIRELMEFLGNPQDSYKIIHIAGTSGKTSTAYYCSAILQASGQKVGLTVSPHVDEVNERVQVNLTPLPEKTFCSQLAQFLKIIEKSPVRPTYFELLIAFAYWHFEQSKVDYAVIEVGLGGLLDGTNVVNRKDKICVLTDIGLDHTEVLGKTLPEIAAQKAGIIQPYNIAFCYQQDEEVMEVLREVCEQKQAELHEVLPLKASELPKELPLFQRRNWFLALIPCQYLAKRDNLPELTADHLSRTVATYIPARMEIISYRGKTLIIDGAHNDQKLSALVKSVRHEYPKQPIAALVGFVNTKQNRLSNSLEPLLPLVSHLFATSFVSHQDMHKVSIDPIKIVESCEELDFHDWEIEVDPKVAFAKLLKRPEEILLVTGSFYLLNHIRPLLKSTK